ncbi:hypothetical protein [Mesorhizobium sp. B3-1-7]|uniref:hypothetical protein n=1 Tax=unclassified Mesorhizobium TaxID=325217 RepID=UPI0032B11A55
MTILSYDFPHSTIDRTTKITHGQEIELTGDVTHVDEAKVTVNLGIPVTVSADTVRLVMRNVPPKRKTPLMDKAT